MARPRTNPPGSPTESLPCGQCGKRVLAKRRPTGGYLPPGWIEGGALAYCSEQCAKVADDEYAQYQKERKALVEKNVGDRPLIDPWSLAPERAALLKDLEWRGWQGRERFARVIAELKQALPPEPKLQRANSKRTQGQGRQRYQDLPVVLRVNQLLAVIDALSEAAAMGEQWPTLQCIEERYRRALGALNREDEPRRTERDTRVAVNRLLGLPDTRKKGATYDPVRVAQAYQDLITGVAGRPAFDSMGGVDWSRKTWAECGLEPPTGAKADERIVLPLTRQGAITAIANHFNRSEAGIYEALKRSRAGKLPGDWYLV